MSRYTQYYNSKQIFYRNFATSWHKWAETAKLTDLELSGISKFFKYPAKRFGLTKEFRSLGII